MFRNWVPESSKGPSFGGVPKVQSYRAILYTVSYDVRMPMDLLKFFQAWQGVLQLTIVVGSLRDCNTCAIGSKHISKDPLDPISEGQSLTGPTFFGHELRVPVLRQYLDHANLSKPLLQLAVSRARRTQAHLPTA